MVALQVTMWHGLVIIYPGPSADLNSVYAATIMQCELRMRIQLLTTLLLSQILELIYSNMRV